MSKPAKDSLGDRMKGYEDSFRNYLPGRMPAIIRVDGKAFHSVTRYMSRPFDYAFMEGMLTVAQRLCKEVQGVKLAYWQSDEVSLLLTDYDKLTSQAWFDKNIQKMVSVSASIATATFNEFFDKAIAEITKENKKILGIKDYCLDDARLIKTWKPGMFDSRVFVLPKEEVCNYFLWRQQDATRNSINSVGQAHFSHKQLMNKNTDKVQDMLFTQKGINWNDLPVWQKRGACVVKDAQGQWKIDTEIPVFSQNREYITKLVYVGEE